MPSPRFPVRRAAVVLAGALLIALPAQLWIATGRRAPVVSTPTPQALPGGPGLPQTLPIVPTARPTPRPPEPTPTPTPEPGPRLAAFAGLGAWVDLFDFGFVDPVAAVADMRAHGVRTLYLQTGRYNSTRAVDQGANAWLVAAHEAGLEVVGWYLPGYKNVAKDVRRTVGIATYEFAGHRFDGLGIDIEYKDLVRDPPRWNARVVEHARLVRDLVARDFPVAVIAPPPLQMDVAPTRWAGFPWPELGEIGDVMMLMSYWSFRDCPDVPDHCALPFTQKNIEITRELMGVDKPVHTIGGVGDSIGAREVEDFVVGAERADAFGASLYDYRTTKPRFWASLERLAAL